MSGSGDPYGMFDEFYHMAQQGSQQQITGVKSAYIGYVVSYDPLTNTVVVTNPLGGTVPNAQQNIGQGDNTTGVPMLSAPIPLATAYAGISNGINPINNTVISGIVIAPLGGANRTSQGQTAGEQVLVLNLNNEIGYSACAFMLFNNIAISPGSKPIILTSAPIQPGEWLFVQPSGTQIYIQNNGNATLYSMQPGAAAGGNIYLFATGLGDGMGNFGGGITLQTGLINTVPTPPLETGDITIRSINVIRLAAPTIGSTSEFQTTLIALNVMSIDGHDALNLQSSLSDVNVLAADTFNAVATNKVVLTALPGANLTLTDQATLNATHITLNAQDGDLNLNAETIGSVFIFGAEDAWVTSDMGDAHIVANTGNIFINTNTGANVAGSIDITSAVDVLVTAVNDINIAPQNDINLNAGVDVDIAAPGGNVTIISAFQATITAGVLMSIGSGENIVIEAVQAATLQADNGFCTVSALVGNANITAGQSVNLLSVIDVNILPQNNCSITAAGGSIFLTTAGGAGNITLTTMGTVGINANNNIEITCGVGSNITAIDTSGNTALQLLTAAFVAFFNTHTHPTPSGDSSPPDQTLTAGYPMTTNALLAN